MNTPGRIAAAPCVRGVAAIAAALAVLASVAGAEEPKWKPSPSPLVTRYAERLSPKEIPSFEFYPRPSMSRRDGGAKNLMGLWDYALTEAAAKAPPASWQGRIMAPFPIESALSGVKRRVGPNEKLWYHLAAEVEWGAEWLKGQNARLLLRLDGVNRDATVFVNGKEVGSHRGGDDAFCFDVTDLVTEKGKHVMDIVVAAAPAADGGEWAATGITKPAWIEGAPAARIESLNFVGDPDTGLVHVTAEGTFAAGDLLEVVAYDRGAEAARTSGPAGQELLLALKKPKAWTPDYPFVYEYEASIKHGDRYVDRVRSIFAVRKVLIGKGEKGASVVMLNQKPLFLAGVVDASWWPDGGCTAPTAEAVRRDIERMKQLGFNLVRKACPTDQPHWYWWCDRLGLLVWQELPPGDTQELVAEYPRIIRDLGSHACIIGWALPAGLKAEAAAQLTQIIRKADPTRLVVGGPEGDVREVSPADMDKEKGPKFRWPWQEEPPAQALVVAPLGGIQWPIMGHTYGAPAPAAAGSLGAEYLALAPRMAAWRTKAVACGYVYKQFADAGPRDCSGLITCDREVIKLDLELAAKADPASWAVPRVRTIVPSGRMEAGDWQVAAARPTDDWSKPSFDASGWSKGAAAFGANIPQGLAIRTEWKAPDLWIRRAFTLDTAKLHDPWVVFRGVGDLELFLNGTRLAEKRSADGARYEMLRAGRGLAGANVLGAHAHADPGRGFLDAGLVDLLPQRDTRLPAGLKPIIDVWMRDPCVCLGPDGVYYLVGTGTTAAWKCDGIPLYKSPDLKRWEFVKIVVEVGQFEGAWVLNNRVRKDVPIWAPELHYIRGAYWLTFCTGWAREGGQAGTGLLKSTSGRVEGPYELVNKEGPITPGHLDATLFQDDDGTVYFLSGGATIARMKDDMSGVAEKPHDIGSDRGGRLGFEGIFLFKRNGKYYLDVTDAPLPYNTYDCMVGISDKVEGPYRQVHIAVPHGGHNMFFKDKAGRWWSTFFGGDLQAPFDQQPGLLRVEFAADGTIHPLFENEP